MSKWERHTQKWSDIGFREYQHSVSFKNHDFFTQMLLICFLYLSGVDKKVMEFLVLFFQCLPISGLGFRRGSYKCVCKIGYYFSDTSSHNKYFNGTTLEEEYAKILEVSCSKNIHLIFVINLSVAPRVKRASMKMTMHFSA